MRVALLTACSANVVAMILQRPANLADGSTGAEGHADERAPNNDAPTSRSLMFATVPQKMTYSSGTVVPTQGPGAPPEGFLPLVNWQKGVKCWAPDGSNEVRFKGSGFSFTGCAAKCTEDDKCTHFTHQSDNHCTTRKGCAHLKAVPTTRDYDRADSYEKLPTCSSAPKPQGQQLAPGKTTCACQERSAGKDNVCVSSDCSDCFEPMTCGCPSTDYTFKSNVEGSTVCGTNCDNVCFEIDNDHEYEDPSICALKQGRIAISDMYADRRDEVASQQTGKTIHQTVTELRDEQTENSVNHITGIWCYMLADCTAPGYNREAHGPCVDNCELFYTQNPSNCRQRLCKHDHSGNYQNQFTGMCKASNPFYCPDE